MNNYFCNTLLALGMAGALGGCLASQEGKGDPDEMDKATAGLIERLWDQAVETSETCGLPRPPGAEFSDFRAQERQSPGTGLAYFQSLPNDADACACAHAAWEDPFPIGTGQLYPFSMRLYQTYLAGEVDTLKLTASEWSAIMAHDELLAQLEMILAAAGDSLDHATLHTGGPRPLSAGWLAYAAIYTNGNAGEFRCFDHKCTISASPAENFWGFSSDVYSALHTFTITPVVSYQIDGDEVELRLAFSLYDYYDWSSYERGPWQAQLGWLAQTCGLASAFAIQDATRDVVFSKRFSLDAGGGITPTADPATWIAWPAAQRPAFMQLP